VADVRVPSVAPPSHAFACEVSDTSLVFVDDPQNGRCPGPEAATAGGAARRQPDALAAFEAGIVHDRNRKARGRLPGGERLAPAVVELTRIVTTPSFTTLTLGVPMVT
jgi:hypothetical protein